MSATTLITTIEDNHIIKAPAYWPIGEQVVLTRRSEMEKSVEIPVVLAHFHLPDAVQARLQWLLDKQDTGKTLTEKERNEAKGLVELAEFLSLLNLRAMRMVAEA